ncbi:hypothetical protein [Clostridium felsineum]|uniref:hypothetical protein n=1 Tax=Clostridium felsineum TaxID=36839 RepID=UPI00098C122E|nr:hypothetical protein [Clostridium felsineum]URZ18775.1 hypothetical protein CLFE_048630 [Clostridium felsineum DSM 794]
MIEEKCTKEEYSYCKTCKESISNLKTYRISDSAIVFAEYEYIRQFLVESYGKADFRLFLKDKCIIEPCFVVWEHELYKSMFHNKHMSYTEYINYEYGLFKLLIDNYGLLIDRGNLLMKTIEKNQKIVEKSINKQVGKSFGNVMFERKLMDNNIQFKSEKTFEGCKDKKALRFDFYLQDLNEVVEIDGLQHKKVVEYFGGKLGYLDRVKKDKIKNNYCENNKIKITRIVYDPNKIEQYNHSLDIKINQILKECKKGRD